MLQVSKETVVLNRIAQLSLQMLHAMHVLHEKLMQLHGSAELVSIELKYWSSDLP